MNGDGAGGWVDVVCTDGGRHEQLTLSGVALHTTGGGAMSNEGSAWWPPTPDAAPGSGQSRTSYTFRCAICRRAPRIRSDLWWPALHRLADGGYARLDISALPF